MEGKVSEPSNNKHVCTQFSHPLLFVTLSILLVLLDVCMMSEFEEGIFKSIPQTRHDDTRWGEVLIVDRGEFDQGGRKQRGRAG